MGKKYFKCPCGNILFRRTGIELGGIYKVEITKDGLNDVLENGGETITYSFVCTSCNKNCTKLIKEGVK